MEGMDLKVERVRARVTVTALAECMGLSRQRVTQIENAPRVRPAAVARYREALRVAVERNLADEAARWDEPASEATA